MRLQDVTFVVTDTETTGGKAGADRVIELAAVKVRGGAVVDRFSQLINPERSIPRRITEITGITTGMVFNQPVAAEVFPAYLDFLGEAVFVAHHAPFDLGFINAELERMGAPALANPVLCTLRLARRLLAGLRSKGLGSVAAFYGITIDGRHRALGDAEATAQVLLRFLEQLAGEHELETLDDLLAFQHRTYARAAGRREPAYLRRIREEVLPALPPRPGVYFLKDRRGAILYIGKARRLSDRVRSYFTAIEAHPPRIRRLVEAVRDVAWEETGSELAALLRESRLIKAHQPRFNRALRHERSRPFIRLDTTEPFPRVSWTSYLRNDGAEYFGPLGGRRQAEQVVDLIHRFFKLRECDDDTFARGRACLYAELDRCGAPCEGGAAAEHYAREVEQVRAFLTGRDTSVQQRIEEAMHRAARALDFEAAARYRDGLHRLRRLQEKQQCIAASVLDHHAVLLQPGLEPHRVQLFLVRYGRLVDTVTMPRRPASPDVDALKGKLAEWFGTTQVEPERYLKKEVDEVRILAHWMYVHREDAHQISWHPGMTVEALLASILDRLTREAAGAVP